MKSKSGKIIKLLKNRYIVLIDSKLYDCKARGKFRNIGVSPVVGDNVNVDIISDTEGYIMQVLERKNELKRPQISNVDIACILTSAVEPNFSSNLLDKMISVVEMNNIEPVICFTKLDIATPFIKKEIKKYIKYYKSIGYKVFTNRELFKIKKAFKNKTIVFTGQSGVGKSTLLNKIDKNLDIETASISKALGRGKHTTRHVELLAISNFIIADTPGFSSLDINEYTKEQIRDSFREFRNRNCKYRECMHLKEPECIVKKEISENKIKNSRYINYKKFLEE